MIVTTLVDRQSLGAFEYRCTAGPDDRPFAEVHAHFTLSYVRKGSFGCRTRGRSFECVAGALFVGYPGDEYTCLHDHHDDGDECLSFRLAPSLVDAIGEGEPTWRVAMLPPVAEIAVFGELAQAAANGRSDVGLDEAGMLLASRFVDIVARRKRTATVASGRSRRRAVEAARWLEEHAQQPVTLEAVAASAGFSSFHFLRLFRDVVGITPHQYLLRCRLRYAAQHLTDPTRSITGIAYDSGFSDLSNFVRTFRRAAGVSPRAFRRMAGKDRRALRERLVRAR
jgi:AraC-like DNA-binding protein